MTSSKWEAIMGHAANLVTIGRFNDTFEAHVARSRLVAAGIPVFLLDEQTVGVAWQLTIGLGGVKLQVVEADAERALRILASPLERDPDESESAETDAGAVVAEGDAADASEGAATTEDEDKPAEPPGPDEPVVEDVGDDDDDGDGSDYEFTEQPIPPACTSEADSVVLSYATPPAMTHREQNAERAWRAAVLGILFFPLHGYVTLLLVSVLFSPQRLRPRSRRRALGAAAINLPVVLAVFAGLAQLLRSMSFSLF